MMRFFLSVLFMLLFMGVPAYPSSGDQARSKLIDFFEPVKAIKLETLDICLISQIAKVVYIKPYILILDDVQGIVFQFDEDGRFVRIFGQVGAGPGEYLQPGSLVRVFEDQVGLYDRGSGQLKVYDLDGGFVHETPRVNKSMVIPRHAFLWPQRDQLILADFSSVTDRQFWHLISDAALSEKKALFGSRESPEDKGQPPVSFSSFMKVGEHLWTGSPYTYEIIIYDMNGKLVKRFLQPNPAARLGAYYKTAFAKLPDGTTIRLRDLEPRKVNSGFAYFEPYVITRCAFVVNIFTADFRHLASVDGAGFHYLNDGGSYAIKQAPELERASDLAAVDEREQMLLDATDWQTADHSEANPYLTLWQAKSKVPSR